MCVCVCKAGQGRISTIKGSAEPYTELAAAFLSSVMASETASNLELKPANL